MKIGFYDSGIGGLSVLHEAYHQLPEEEYLFYADTDHVPYGTKEKEEILGFARESVNFLVEQGVDAVVIACNTATSVAVEILRQEYSLPIVSMEPAVKPAVEHADHGRILVIATPVTLREAKLKNLIDRVDERHQVDLLPMPELVRFAETEKFSGDEVLHYLEDRFKQVDTSKYSTLVLGCTHFNYFKDLYRQFFPGNIQLMDGNYGTVRHLAHRLGIERRKESERIIFTTRSEMLRNTVYFASGRKVEDPDMLEHFRRLHNRLEDMREIQ